MTSMWTGRVVRNAEREARAVRIPSPHAADDVHVHGLPETAG